MWPVSIIYAVVVTTGERYGHASPCQRSPIYENGMPESVPTVERMEPQRKATTFRALTTPPRLFMSTTKFLEYFASVVFRVNETNNLTGGYRNFHSKPNTKQSFGWVAAFYPELLQVILFIIYWKIQSNTTYIDYVMIRLHVSTMK
jgi:hypothetical protein